jgi:hypothetical protein
VIHQATCPVTVIPEQMVEAADAVAQAEGPAAPTRELAGRVDPAVPRVEQP